MSNRYAILFVFLTALLVVSGCAPAESNLAVTDPWARAATVESMAEENSTMAESEDNAGAMAGSGAVSAAYMGISNTGGAADRLISASTDAAGVVEIHTVEMENDIMRMRPLPDGLEIPAGETVTLQPGGYHIMLMDLQHDLTAGESITLLLTFESGKELTVSAPIRMP
ncbi:MAG: copper chaperone PCu(A)C [Anaerolineae bacterium]|nr:copper chaperone PCu(A)C [Anaerolineae bacterium]